MHMFIYMWGIAKIRVSVGQSAHDLFSKPMYQASGVLAGEMHHICFVSPKWEQSWTVHENGPVSWRIVDLVEQTGACPLD